MFAGKRVERLARWVQSGVQARLDPVTRYLGAALIAFLGLLCTIYIRNALGLFGVPITILTTVVAAMFCGLGPGILAAAISVAGVEVLLVGHAISSVGLSGVVRFAVLMLISVLVSNLVAFLRYSLTRAEEAREAAESANREKDAMIAFLSHDLRGPLSSISLTFQLLQRYAKAGGKEAEAQRLSTNGLFLCNRMAHLIQNLLDASKIKSGGIKLSPGDCDMKELMESVYAEHSLLAEEKKIAFKIEVAAEGNFSLVCDRLLVSQVLANLILNAFKFTPSGGTVSLSLSEEGNDLVVKVRDTGQGIPASQLECVFEKFWKAKARMGEGAGLGLFISKAIVNAHRGNISVESEPEKGSCFTIRFPKGQVSSEMGNHQVSLGRVLQSA